MLSNEELFSHIATLSMDIHAYSRPKQRNFHGQGRILYILTKHQDVAQHQLASLAQIKPGSLTEILNRMERDGLIQRTADQADRRVTHVSLTDQGINLSKEIEIEHQQLCRAMFDELDDDERREFDRLIQKIDQNLKATIKKNKDGE